MNLKAHEVAIGNAAIKIEENEIVSNMIDNIEELEKINGRIVFRCYASLTFFIIIDKDSESDLAILDLI